MKRTLLTLTLAAAYLGGYCQTAMVKDYNTTGSAAPGWLTVYKNKLMFMADDGSNGNELGKLDTSGMALVFNINPGTGNAIGYYDNRRMAMTDSGTLFFPANNGSIGNELYKWDGRTAPSVAYDVNAGASGSNITELVAIGRKVFFAYNDITNGKELWSYNEITKSIQRVSNIAPGANSSNPRHLTTFQGRVYFVASNPTAVTGTGAELYMHNPSTNSTTLVADINPGTADADPASLKIINNKLYFSAITGAYGRELYMLDSGNIQRVTDIADLGMDGIPSSDIGVSMLCDVDSNIYFAGDDGTNGTQLYMLDTRTNVSSLVYNINPVGNGNLKNFIRFGHNIYFSANDGSNGNELWMYDGKTDPMLVADLNVGSNNSDPSNMTIYNGVLYFTATDITTGTELYMMKDPASVQNTKFDADVKTYPNPTTSNVYFDMNLKKNETLTIRIADITGREVYNSGMQKLSAGTHKMDVSLNSVAPGVYVYQIINNNGVNYLSGRIVKQ